MSKTISDRAIKRRQYWIEEIRKLSGNFGADTDRLEKELENEINKSGVTIEIDELTGKKMNSSTMAFAWFVWKIGYEGEPIIRWL